MYSKEHILNMIRELGIYSIKINEDQWCVNLEIGLTKPKKQEPHNKDNPFVKSKLYMNGNELDIGCSKVDLEIEVPERTIDIIKEKSDILTKDLEECNETPIIDNKIRNIVIKKNVRAGEHIYPNDFELEHIPKRKRKSNNKGRNKKVNKMSRELV